MNILISEKRFSWYRSHHVSLELESLGVFVDADGTTVNLLTKKEFDELYIKVKTYNFDVDLPDNAESWLVSLKGKKYSYIAILVILRKFLRSWFGFISKTPNYYDGDNSFICTEIVLKTLELSGFGVHEHQEIMSIFETQKTIELERLKHGLFN